MSREIDITVTLTYDYQPAEPEVNIPRDYIEIDVDGLVNQAMEAAWENETMLQEGEI